MELKNSKRELLKGSSTYLFSRAKTKILWEVKTNTWREHFTRIDMSAQNPVTDIMITRWQLFAKSDMLAGGGLCVNQLIGNAFWLPAEIWPGHATGGWWMGMVLWPRVNRIGLSSFAMRRGSSPFNILFPDMHSVRPLLSKNQDRQDSRGGLR